MRARQIFTGLALALAPATQADCAPTQPAIRMVVSPAALPGRSATPVIFLGGSIDNGSANNWQADLVAALSDQTAIILNPRREEWNPAWRNDAADPHFREQVEWEMAGLERADIIVMYLAPGTQSPVSLLELGLHARSGKVVLYCPDGFWRKGNVDLTAIKYHVTQVRDFAGLVGELRKRIHKNRPAS